MATAARERRGSSCALPRRLAARLEPREGLIPIHQPPLLRVFLADGQQLFHLAGLEIVIRYELLYRRVHQRLRSDSINGRCALQPRERLVFNNGGEISSSE
jgi:hypothetical protein